MHLGKSQLKMNLKCGIRLKTLLLQRLLLQRRFHKININEYANEQFVYSYKLYRKLVSVSHENDQSSNSLRVDFQKVVKYGNSFSLLVLYEKYHLSSPSQYTKLSCSTVMHEAYKSYDETTYPLISRNIKKFLLLRY